MKRLLSLTLAAVFIAAVLASCAVSPTANVNARIRTTSSDATDAAAWLTERLGDKLTGRIVLGTDADGYALDLSALEDDGFFIRSFGREDVLFAKTSRGLDRAVRKYAKMVESGAAVEDVTYHEGCRVERLTINGNDISEYAIVRADDASPCVATASGELASYVEKTCGVRLPELTESEYAVSGALRRIAITEGDETLGDEGFTLSVSEDGTLTVHGGKWRGSLFGVYDLLEDLGWRFIAGRRQYDTDIIPDGTREYLYEAEHIDLTDAINRTEIPSIPVRGTTFRSVKFKDAICVENHWSPVDNPTYGPYGIIPVACHGLQNDHSKIFSGEFEGVYNGLYVEGRQPCFSDETILEAIDAYVESYVQTRLDAGFEIGKNLNCIDLAQWDGDEYYFCKCRDCTKVFIEEGTHCGTVLRMVNREAAWLKDNHPGVKVTFLAYVGTSEVPAKTKPLDNVVPSFCFYYGGYFTCSNHCISGADCDASSIVNNVTPAKNFEDWISVVSPGNITVWYYPLILYNKCHEAPMLRVMLDDMKYLADHGVSTAYFCSESQVFGGDLLMYLVMNAAWDADMSEDEYLALAREWFDIVFGDAGGELFELAMLAERAGDLAGCFSAIWESSPDSVSYDYIALHASQIWDAYERAVALADSAETLAMIEQYAAQYLFMISRACYDDMYANGDTESRETLVKWYAEAYRITKASLLPVKLPEEFDPDDDPRSWMS